MKNVLVSLGIVAVLCISGCANEDIYTADTQNDPVNASASFLPPETCFYEGNWEGLAELSKKNESLAKASPWESESYYGTVGCGGNSFPLQVHWRTNGKDFMDCYAGAAGIVKTDGSSAYELVFVSSKVEGIHNKTIDFIIKCNYFTYYNWVGPGGNPGGRREEHAVFALSFNTETRTYDYTVYIEDGMLEPEV